MPRSRSYGFAFYPRDWNRRFDSAPRRISVRRRRSARGGPPEPPADLCGCGQSVSLRLVPLTGLRLATRADSPARVSRRNPRARSGRIAGFVAVPASPSIRSFGPWSVSATVFRRFSQPVRVSFHLSLKLLLRYRPRRVFRFGRVALPSSRGNSGPRYSCSGQPRMISPTGLSPFFAALSRELRLFTQGP